MKFLRKLIPIQGMELGMHLRADWKQNKRFIDLVSPFLPIDQIHSKAKSAPANGFISYIFHIFGWTYICHLYMRIICHIFGWTVNKRKLSWAKQPPVAHSSIYVQLRRFTILCFVTSQTQQGFIKQRE